MKRLLAWSLIITLLLAVLAVAGGVLLWQEIASQPEMSISINGEHMAIHELDLGDWIVAMLACAFAVLTVIVVVPLSLLLGLGLPLLLIGGALALGALLLVGVGVIAAAPLLLPLLLLWWLLRRDRRTLSKASGKPQAQQPAGASADA
jgi:hypothetical protein